MAHSDDKYDTSYSDDPSDFITTDTSCQTASEHTLQKQGNPPRPAQIKWTNSHTDKLVEWLEKHPKCRYVLFSDSTTVAKEENREVLKTTNDDLRIAVDHHCKRFGEAVQNRLTT
ncbi:hypothetical protein SERLA73DRAFT_75820 [Serpula lacrymans var. lacrymans S7.3]|uniref:Uncharacterized protein n=2 Tax=Serpula lacrymans var. lacrymans TaxID=341189 RepID=F8Q4C1_SERL3|nr:uncharacterized protein SERLADRAFT_440584 [Serpula lacrymans var. lacrymans S7.9]EGN96976.1 hypothetical protein SERLA73DRAFT_75820 [Serpula lacrymans var. lacrymans S7.3]EGO22570.1 hypothetical protein SERLADRAFT_440584 [Serpula lacrymans var. lacrymans S7.9]